MFLLLDKLLKNKLTCSIFSEFDIQIIVPKILKVVMLLFYRALSKKLSYKKCLELAYKVPGNY